ncbi:retinoic acid receptor RXR-alpha-A-like isoform X1 [Haliotis rufescens]|uniref:retinoic acid receptor RXR-alpha-A-like isoform X1 n=1 Tax=Haliotis rufescens TaxID=6454 RepID=UPI001EAFA83B|nr:retinoic acid receptor RXR-alpha-A-like isoform X1 [Haliotis rufescens]XP_048237592.1 retinoic acid receptor RXR-alpha-A-like isoform X1 [Haliotis rufescens]
MNHNMGTHPIVSDTSQGSSNHAIQSTVSTMPNQAAYLAAAFNNAADSYNGQFAVFDSKPSYVPHISKETHFKTDRKNAVWDIAGYAQLYDVHCGMYSVTSPTNLSPSPPPPPRIYKPCVVCNDKSSGYHYGVSSCEGCKGFFRRSVQKNMQYTCHKDKNCPINKVTRNRCQYCRLQKCFAAGMSKEAVRNDRNKKRKVKPECTSSPNEDLTGDDQNLIQDILDAHRATFISDMEDSPESPSLKPREEEDSVILWERISELSSDGIVKIVDFAKKLPGFSTLSQSDQITLLKAACLEIMILRLSARYDAALDSMVFMNGVTLNKDQLQQGGFGNLTGTIFSFAASLKAMSTDETEFAILSAICLISGDRSGLQDTEKIEQMQEPLLEALKHYTRSRRQEQPHIFAKLLMKLTDLRSISVKGEKQTLRFALDHLANALSLLEAPASSQPIIKKEPLSDDEPSSSRKPSSTTFMRSNVGGQNVPQYQGTVHTNINLMAMNPSSVRSPEFMGSRLPSPRMGPLPDSSIPSPLGMGMSPRQLSPNQTVSVGGMGSMGTPSPPFPSVTSPNMPNYLTGLSPTLSPISFSSSSYISSMMSSPVASNNVSSSVDENIMSNIHNSISDGMQSMVPNMETQQFGLTQNLNRAQIDEILRSSHLLGQQAGNNITDLETMKHSYNPGRNNTNNNTNGNGIMPTGLYRSDVNGTQLVLNDVGPSTDHHAPLSKIIAGAMTDSMQI